MGRYYSGDIKGKFWFGVQDSNDASFFGGRELEPGFIEHDFEKDDLPEIQKGIKECLKKLGKNKNKLDTFFAEKGSYNKTMLIEYGFKEEEIYDLLEWYAKLEIGEKILKCVQKKGYCLFKAEL